VEKLEVVNKKWVRVRLMSGNTVDGSVSVVAGCYWLFIFFHTLFVLASLLSLWSTKVFCAYFANIWILLSPTYNRSILFLQKTV
jgi:hypothetical protein